MRRADLIAFERFLADTYRREAANRRIEALRCGPLFVAEEA